MKDALIKSIQKWQDIVDGKNTDGPYSTNCPLCEVFYGDYCNGCPVMENGVIENLIQKNTLKQPMKNWIFLNHY